MLVDKWKRPVAGFHAFHTLFKHLTLTTHEELSQLIDVYMLVYKNIIGLIVVVLTHRYWSGVGSAAQP